MEMGFFKRQKVAFCPPESNPGLPRRNVAYSFINLIHHLTMSYYISDLRLLITRMLIKITIWTVYVCVASWIFASPVESERILALAPIAAQSHWNFMKGILRALTDRGHHVTVFTSFPENSRENYTVVDMSKELPTYLRLGVDDAKKQFGGSSHLIRSVSQWSRNSFQSIYDSDVMRKIRAAPTPGFDVVFVEIMASECVSYLSVELNVPLVYVSPPPLLSYVDRSVIGHHPNPAAVSDTISAYSIPRTFVQRFVNTLSLMYTYGLVQYYNTWNVNEADKRPFDRAVPAKPSIVFSNGHLTIDTARPLPPNVIQIGGIHLSAPRKIPKVSDSAMRGPNAYRSVSRM